MSGSGILAVVFDWAGTMVDFGSRAPVAAFIETFAAFGVEVTEAEVRAEMGLSKRDHIAALMAEPRIAAAWERARGTPPADADVDRALERFEPLSATVAARHAGLVPGARGVLAVLRDRGIRVGSTTGYTRAIMEGVTAAAAAQGYEPDCLVCAGDLAAGRPTPLMMYRCFADLGVWEPWRVVKVDDTAPGIAEGVAAGSWAVGCALSGNAAGLPAEELARKRRDAVEAIRERAAASLRAAGAHAVIDSVADLIPALDRIEARLAAGERPGAERTLQSHDG